LNGEGLWKSYDQGAVPVLHGVDFHAAEGEIVALRGASGCGKSTLLNLLGGLDEPDRGTVYVNREPLGPGSDRVRLRRREIGFVFQFHHLIPDLTAAENCLLPALAAGTDPGQARDRLRTLAEQTGVARRLDHRVQKLSGGERQRVALCRALVNRPRILLADEPTGSLDEQSRELVFRLLLQLSREDGVTLVVATHDPELARLCNRVVFMKDGRTDAAG
jgi:ABC-type lipoprotein export system ATPase subunit